MLIQTFVNRKVQKKLAGGRRNPAPPLSPKATARKDGPTREASRGAFQAVSVGVEGFGVGWPAEAEAYATG